MTTTPAETEMSAAADAVDRARAARPILAEHAAATEERGRPTEESRAAAEHAGAFAVTTPVEFGGLGADQRTMAQIFIELGAGCASTSWLGAVSATAKSFFFDWMPPTVQQAVYADPNVRVCGTAMPLGRAEKVDGGYLIDGRWPYASGCLDAGWATLGLATIDGVQPKAPCLAVLPTASLAIDRTWDEAIGLRGTGSHTLVGERVFVAGDFLIGPPQGGQSFGMRQVPVLLHTVTPLVGAARGALDLIADFMTAQRPVVMSPYPQRSQSPSARQLFLEASELVDSAEMRTLRVADMADSADAAGMSEKEMAHAHAAGHRSAGVPARSGHDARSARVERSRRREPAEQVLARRRDRQPARCGKPLHPHRSARRCTDADRRRSE